MPAACHSQLPVVAPIVGTSVCSSRGSHDLRVPMGHRNTRKQCPFHRPCLYARGRACAIAYFLFFPFVLVTDYNMGAHTSPSARIKKYKERRREEKQTPCACKKKKTMNEDARKNERKHLEKEKKKRTCKEPYYNVLETHVSIVIILKIFATRPFL